MSETIFLSGASYTHTYQFNFTTENIVIAVDNKCILISNTKVKKFPYNSILIFFECHLNFIPRLKLIERRFATFFIVRRHASATINLWVDQRAVCSALKLDTFTLVTTTFEWLDRFWKTVRSLWKLIRLQKFAIAYFLKIQTSFFIKEKAFIKKHSKCYTFFQTHPVYPVKTQLKLKL